MVESKPGEKDLRKARRPERRYQHTEHRRSIHSNFRWHRFGLFDLGLRILVVPLPTESQQPKYISKPESHAEC